MNDFAISLNEFSQGWFEMMSRTVVQSLGLALFAMAIMTLPRSLPASYRFCMWQAVALKFLLLPFSIFVLALPVLNPRVASDIESLPYTVIYPDSKPDLIEATHLSHSISAPSRAACLFVVWLVIVAIQFGYFLQRRLKLASLLKSCTPASQTDTERLSILAEQLQLRKSVTLLNGDVQMPFVAGIFRPTIVLPRESSMDRKRFDQVIFHELTHVKRNDLLWVWIPELARVLFFFHPLVYWIQYQANLWREIACDESVLQTGTSRKDYAQTLLDLAGAKPMTS